MPTLQDRLEVPRNGDAPVPRSGLQDEALRVLPRDLHDEGRAVLGSDAAEAAPQSGDGPVHKIEQGDAGRRGAKRTGAVVGLEVLTDFVTIGRAADITGLTAKAINRKIESGVWLHGREFWRRAGRIFIDIKGYERWVRGLG